MVGTEGVAGVRPDWRGRGVAADCSGQMTPFFLCFLVVMLLFLALVINLGQAVNRRMALQIVADSGAWAGATDLAIGMNKLSQLNGYRHDIWPIASVGMPIFGPIQRLDKTVHEVWNAITTVINVLDMAINVGFTKRAFDSAKHASTYNLNDLFPGELYDAFQMDEGMSDTFGGVFSESEMPLLKSRQTVCYSYLDDTVDPPGVPLYPCLMPEEAVEETLFYVGCEFITFVYVCYPVTWTLTKWYKRDDNDTATFVWVVKAPPVDPFFNPFNLFTNAIPSMTAAAAARPVGGNFEEGDDSYRVRMVPLRAARWSFGAFLKTHITDGETGHQRPVLF